MTRLLFDANLSPRLVAALEREFPGSKHVFDLGLREAGDEAIWQHAKAHGFVLVSKDEDFYERAFVRGPPPKFVWMRVGNCSTARSLLLLRARAGAIEELVASQDASFLSIG